MVKQKIRKEPVDRYIIDPMSRFLNNSTMSGIVLFSAALLAIILSNSPWSDAFHHIWETKISIGFSDWQLSKTFHHWINDGLMAVFFFVVGLELKREIISGELSNPRNAILPIAAAIGGMIVPALIYLLFNPSGEVQGGWGTPMATDIAFALGILYLLGDKVPVSLKIFLTALAIADDLGAVLVIAFFYTSDINMISLLTGAVFLFVLFVANRIGVRSTIFYGIIGIGGLWLAFLMSGVHATIAAVLAAFTIPARVKYSETTFDRKLTSLMDQFRRADPNNSPTVTSEQLHILEKIRYISKNALTPLQRLEHAMHPLVAFVIMPLFALANAGITLSGDSITNLTSSVTLGVFFGLVLGKVIGVVGFVSVVTRLKLASLPKDFTRQHLLGVGFLAGIGFTMSLFISQLAFANKVFVEEAKMGILLASLFAGLVGYFIIKTAKQVK
ncbi:MAG: Na+/H+ antiporter NhaA [Bacteroidetes bacterium HGW-Bacteroidetes-9]|jgi:NhaA family Na+:H+ antiporter|nr:MAG: Na+/H+ antiporter NhaA [Bacteroidetes bacterium HGW-Bacteroidetes-9]